MSTNDETLAGLIADREFWTNITNRLTSATTDDATQHNLNVIHRTAVRQHMERLDQLIDAATFALSLE